MIIFHDLVYDGSFSAVPSGVGKVYSPAPLVSLMGQVDVLHVSGYAAQVSGSAPVLSIITQSSGDGYLWTTDAGPIVSAALSTSSDTIFQGLSGSTLAAPVGPHRRLAISVACTAATFVGHLKVWVTGRDTYKGAQGLVAVAPAT